MISSFGSTAFSNNGNFGSLFENLVNVVNSNDCLEFGCGITMGSNFVSFGFSKLNIFLFCFGSDFVSTTSSFISGTVAFEAIIFDDNSYNLSSCLDRF